MIATNSNPQPGTAGPPPPSRSTQQTRRRPSIGSMQCPPRRGAPALDWIQSSSSATSAPMKLGEPSHVRAHAVRSGTRPGRVRPYCPTLHVAKRWCRKRTPRGHPYPPPIPIHLPAALLDSTPASLQLASALGSRHPPTPLPPLCRQQEAGA